MNDTIRNRENAIEFYKMAFNGNPREAFKLFVGTTYIQHNPSVKNRIQVFIEYLKEWSWSISKNLLNLFDQQPNGTRLFYILIKFSLKMQYITMDFFRFDDHGKIIEHWDAIQKIPEKSETIIKCINKILLFSAPYTFFLLS